MHTTTEDSVRIVESSRTVEVMAYSPDGDPLAYVEITKGEALELPDNRKPVGEVVRASLWRIPEVR